MIPGHPVTCESIARAAALPIRVFTSEVTEGPTSPPGAGFR